MGVGIVFLFLFFFFFWGGGHWAPPVEPYKKIKRSNGVKRKLGQFLWAADPVMVI